MRAKIEKQDDMKVFISYGDTSDQVEYLDIKSTVTSNVIGKQIPPVTVDSLVAPTAKKAESQGVLGVKVVNRNGVGIQDL